MKRRGFVFVAGSSQMLRVADILKELPMNETILIYSSWDGYYTIPEQVEANSDGNERISMETGDKIFISKAENTTKIIKLRKVSFLEILNKKMGDIR